jgi:Flp pilus assembly protein CpaB
VATAVWVTTSAFLPRAAPEGVRVVVVAQNLMAGHVLTLGDLVVTSWPTKLTPEGTVGNSGALVGRALGAAMTRGEPVTTARVRGPGLLTGVPTGMVAAHVRLADPAMASITVAGDRVDLISAAGRLVAADVVVLAVDASTSGTSGWSSAAPSSLPGGVIVAIAPDAAARLATVDPSGQLDATFSLVMRGPVP